MALSVEALIKEAIDRGDFAEFKGKGKPLEEDKFANLPEELRMTYRVLKNANVPPSEVNIKKAIAELNAKIESCKDPHLAESFRKKVRLMETELNIKLEKIKNLK